MSRLLRRAIQQVLGGLNAADVFDITLYTGDALARSITSGLDLSTEGGLVWIKPRDSATTDDHNLFDTIRGATEALSTNLTDAEIARANTLTSFDLDGFSLGGNTRTNQSGINYVAWQFLKAAGFLDIITYTGDGSTNRTIPHALNQDVGMLVVKDLSNVRGWHIQHRSRGGTAVLNFSTSSESTGVTYWNNTPASSTEFTVANNAGVNSTGANYVAYLFAHDPSGVIQCGGYTGNGSATGPVVTLGWVPQYVMIKRATGGTGTWAIFDTARGIGIVTGSDQKLEADTTAAEIGADYLNLTADGFQIVTTTTSANASGSDYIYMAIKAPV